MERGKTREASGSNHNDKKLILQRKIEHKNNFLYLPLW